GKSVVLAAVAREEKPVEEEFLPLTVQYIEKAYAAGKIPGGYVSKEIFAYVKNKTKDNNYYWVFANVTPSIDINNNIIGYYSVRR
ncbi:hypothetical protein VWN77_10375, partial [Campylobacter coli]